MSTLRSMLPSDGEQQRALRDVLRSHLDTLCAEHAASVMGYEQMLRDVRQQLRELADSQHGSAGPYWVATAAWALKPDGSANDNNAANAPALVQWRCETTKPSLEMWTEMAAAIRDALRAAAAGRGRGRALELRGEGFVSQLRELGSLSGDDECVERLPQMNTLGQARPTPQQPSLRVLLCWVQSQSAPPADCLTALVPGQCQLEPCLA